MLQAFRLIRMWGCFLKAVNPRINIARMNIRTRGVKIKKIKSSNIERVNKMENTFSAKPGDRSIEIYIAAVNRIEQTSKGKKNSNMNDKSIPAVFCRFSIRGVIINDNTKLTGKDMIPIKKNIRYISLLSFSG
jgi:hypothetical protein